MKTEQAIEIAGQLEDFLNIPSFLCEYLQKELEEEHYQEVIEYIIERKNEDVENQKEKCLKEIERLHSIIKALHKYFEEHEQYEDNEFLRQLESCTEKDTKWLKKMGGE